MLIAPLGTVRELRKIGIARQLIPASFSWSSVLKPRFRIRVNSLASWLAVVRVRSVRAGRGNHSLFKRSSCSRLLRGRTSEFQFFESEFCTELT